MVAQSDHTLCYHNRDGSETSLINYDTGNDPRDITVMRQTYSYALIVEVVIMTLRNIV